MLHVALRAIDNLKILFLPFIPFSSQRLHELLGFDTVIAGELESREITAEAVSYRVLTGDYSTWVGRWRPSELPAGQKLREPAPLFVKLDPERVVADELERMRSAATE